MINGSENICAIENILVSPVHSLVHTSPIFLRGIASDPPSLLHYLSAESVTPKGIPKPHDKPPNMVPYVPTRQDSDPILSDSIHQNRLTCHNTIIIIKDDVQKGQK